MFGDYVGAAGEVAGEFPERESALGVAPGVDELEDGLGLREVDAAAQVGALGELAGSGETNLSGGEFGEERGGERGTADDVELDDVLAGVGARCAHQVEKRRDGRGEGGKLEGAANDRPGGKLGGRRTVLGVEEFGRHGDRPGTAHAHNRPLGGERRRRHGRDGIGGFAAYRWSRE